MPCLTIDEPFVSGGTYFFTVVTYGRTKPA
jgi:hypothetical protein